MRPSLPAPSRTRMPTMSQKDLSADPDAGPITPLIRAVVVAGDIRAGASSRWPGKTCDSLRLVGNVPTPMSHGGVKLRTARGYCHVPYKGRRRHHAAVAQRSRGLIVGHEASRRPMSTPATLRISPPTAQRNPVRPWTWPTVADRACRGFSTGRLGGGLSGPAICPGLCSIRSEPIQKAPSLAERARCSRPAKKPPRFFQLGFKTPDHFVHCIGDGPSAIGARHIQPPAFT